MNIFNCRGCGHPVDQKINYPAFSCCPDSTGFEYEAAFIVSEMKKHQEMLIQTSLNSIKKHFHSSSNIVESVILSNPRVKF